MTRHADEDGRFLTHPWRSQWDRDSSNETVIQSSESSDSVENVQPKLSRTKAASVPTTSHEKQPGTASAGNNSGHSAFGLRKLLRARVTFTCGAFILAAIFLCLTTAYAAQVITFNTIDVVRLSSSYTIFILRLLSGMTEAFMTLTVANAVERLQWLFISRPKGEPFSTFLGLSAGTGFFGMLHLITSTSRIPLSSRVWSICRLLVWATIPTGAILIMSDVSTGLNYYTRRSFILANDIGVQPFNSSVANTSGRSGSIFGYSYGQFLSDTRFAVELDSGHVPWRRKVFMPGGTNAVPATIISSDPGADLLVVHESRGYQLEFEPLPANFTFLPQDCQIYGVDVASVQFCLTKLDGVIAANVHFCNSLTTASDVECSTNRTWTEGMGWNTSLTLSYRFATVAYSIYNNSILTYNLGDELDPAPLLPQDLMHAFQLLFSFDYDSSSSDGGSGLGAISALLSLCGIVKIAGYAPNQSWATSLVFLMMDELENLSLMGSDGSAQGTQALHSILASPIYYFSAYATSRDATARLTKVSLASIGYHVIVGRASIIAYAVLSSAVLLLCLIALLTSTATRAASRIPNVSPFEMYNVLRFTKPTESIPGDASSWAQNWQQVEDRMHLAPLEHTTISSTSPNSQYEPATTQSADASPSRKFRRSRCANHLR